MKLKIHKHLFLLNKTITSIVITLLCCVFLSSVCNAKSISSMRFGQGIGNIRIVFDADGKFDYKVFLLNDPKRLVIDTQNIFVNPRIENTKDINNFISKTRVGTTGVDGTRMVFDLKKPAIIKKVFTLPPQSNFGWRFVVDLELASEREYLSKIGNDNAFSNSSYQGAKVLTKKKPKQFFRSSKNSKKIIVLDPGHGGKDPGAIGHSGVYEKNITLAMARELKITLEQSGKYKVYLTRSTDIFIPLRQRVRIAIRHKADLFLSIHADSARNKKAKGLSVYTLSENASDKEAAALAVRENKADFIVGLDFNEHSKEVSDILINLAQRETLNRSSEFASFMVQEMRKSVRLLSNTHRFAGFAVLKSPDIPAVLLEMGYLSNRIEERLLVQKSYRRKLGVSTKKAIDKYFENMKHASLF